MRTVTLVSEKYMQYLNNCYIDVTEINQTENSVSLPEYLLLPAQLAKLMIRIIVERNPLIKGLPEAQDVILQFMPYSLEILIKDEIKEYFTVSTEPDTELNLDGFVTFRLKDYAGFLNDTISGIIKNYVVQEKYYNFLNMLREYIDRSEPVTEEMHISPRMRFDGTEKMLEELIEFLPRRLVIYKPEDFADKNLLRCIEYVFNNRIVYM